MSLRNRSYFTEGIAAYNRGSRAISRDIYGADLSVKKKPEKRGKDWGQKIYQKALKYAKGLLKYYKDSGTGVTEKDMVDAINRQFKCGRATAKKVAKEAMK